MPRPIHGPGLGSDQWLALSAASSVSLGAHVLEVVAVGEAIAVAQAGCVAGSRPDRARARLAIMSMCDSPAKTIWGSPGDRACPQGMLLL